MSSNISLSVKEEIKKLFSSDPVKRASAACALGKIGNRAVPAIPALISLLGDCNRIEPQQVEPLIAALQDQHPRTRAVAAASLGQIRDSRTVLPLIDALKDESAQVRMYAAASLGQQGDSRARDALNDAFEG